MSMTWHLMSTRTSSNTAKRPTGPAPTITACVLMTSDMGVSELLVRNADHEAIKRPGRLAASVLDIDMAGGASAGAATFGGDAGDRILHRGFHHRHAGLRLDDAFRPVFLNKGD